MSTPIQPHTKWPVSVLLGAAGALAVALLVLAFLWPTKTAEAQNLPVSIAGPEAAVTALEDALAQAAPDTLELVAALDRADAVRQIETRETYGAIVLSPDAAPEVLTAPAGSAAATQILTGIAARLQSMYAQQVAAAGGDAAAAQVAVTAVVPLSEDDPNGTGLAAASFPLTMGGMIGGILVSLLVVGTWRRLAALGAFAVATGIVIALVMQTWFAYLQGEFWLNALAIGLSVLATASFIVGATALLGRAGIAVGAIVTMLFANPLSAAAMPWQFITAPWGAIGQYLVPGASNWLLRSLSYFPEAPTAQQWWTLVAWTVLGITLSMLGHFRNRASMRVAAGTLEAAPA